MVFLAKTVLEMFGDGVTVISRRGESFAEITRFAAENDVFWRFALLDVGLAWSLISLYGYTLYVVFEPVSKRLAQLTLVLRLGACFVGGASLMFRVAQARLYQASTTEGLFTTEQLHTLVGVVQRGAGAGVTTACMFLGAGSALSFLLFLRSGYLPRAFAAFGIFASALLVAVAVAAFVFPQLTNPLKLLAVPSLLTEVTLALWLVFKGLQPGRLAPGLVRAAVPEPGAESQPGRTTTAKSLRTKRIRSPCGGCSAARGLPATLKCRSHTDISFSVK